MPAAKIGGTLRIGSVAYNSSLEPYGLREAGSLGLAGIPGEYLTWTNNKFEVKPWLATSWKPNAALTVWTFQIRKGVKFHNGKTLNADDVVASFKQYLNQKTSQILSALPANDDRAIGCRQDGAVLGAVPAQGAEQRVPVPRQPDDLPGDHPAGRDRGTTGHLGVERDDRDWPLPPEEPEQAERRARSQQHLLGGQAPARRSRDHVLFGPRPDGARTASGAARPGEQMSPQQARAFKNNSKFKAYTVPVSSHNMFGMRVDRDPFRDARVRRAIALTLNRPDIINRVLLGAGALGNDTPFFPGFASTDPTIHQRKQNLELAKALLKAAGKEDLRFTITTHNQFDVPDYAAAIQAAGRQAGITIDLDVMTYDDYYAAVGGGDRRRQRGVEVEAGEIIEDVGDAVPGVAGDPEGHPVGRIGHEAAGMAQDEPDVRILPPYTVAYQQVGGTGGVQQEVRRERQHAGHGGAGKVGGMDEDDL